MHQTPCIVALDPDLKPKAFSLAKMIKRAGCSVSVAFAPLGKDLGDLSKKEAKDVVNNSAPYTDIMGLFHKISEIQSGSVL